MDCSVQFDTRILQVVEVPARRATALDTGAAFLLRVVARMTYTLGYNPLANGQLVVELQRGAPVLLVGKGRPVLLASLRLAVGVFGLG